MKSTLSVLQKQQQGVVFAVAKLLPLLPLLALTMYDQAGDAATYMPYLLFYTAVKTGLLLANSRGQVQNAYKLLQRSLLLCVGALLVLTISSNLIVTDIAAFLLGLGASVVAPSYQGVYYHERLVWHWFLQRVELKALGEFSAVILVALGLASHFSYRWVLGVIALMVTVGLLVMRRFEPFVKQTDAAVFVPKTQSFSNLELFIWTTVMIFAVRYLHYFSARVAWFALVVAAAGLGLLVLRVLMTHQRILLMPRWLTLTALLNGSFESFVLLYLYLAVHTHWLVLLAYFSYACGLLMAQVLRRRVQSWFAFPALKVQLVGMLIGAWLMLTPVTLLIGVWLISFFASANSILLGHAAYAQPVATPAHRLMIKYRSTYLGSIIMQFSLIAVIAGVATVSHLDLSQLMGQLSQTTSIGVTATHFVRDVGVVVVAGLTVITGFAVWRMPGQVEHPLHQA